MFVLNLILCSFSMMRYMSVITCCVVGVYGANVPIAISVPSPPPLRARNIQVLNIYQDIESDADHAFLLVTGTALRDAEDPSDEMDRNYGENYFHIPGVHDYDVLIRRRGHEFVDQARNHYEASIVFFFALISALVVCFIYLGLTHS